MCISKLVYLLNIFSRLNDLIALFKVIASIYLQSATKLMVSKEVVKKNYENELKNQSVVIERNGARLSFNSGFPNQGCEEAFQGVRDGSLRWVRDGSSRKRCLLRFYL